MTKPTESTIVQKKKRITIDGVTLAYEDYGEGKPVVFIHGFPTSTYSWRRVAGPLSAFYRTVSFDLMGFGESDKPVGESYSIDRQAELIQAAITKLGLVRPVLVGHSMGGGACFSVLRNLGKDQHTISGLALVSPACYPQRLPWFFLALRIPILPKRILRLFPPWLAFQVVRDTAYHRKSGMTADDTREYVLNLQTEGAPEAFIATAKEIVPKNMDDLVAWYPDISVPTLVIWGKQDRVIPVEYGLRLSREIPACEFHEFADCGHTPQEERPEEVYAILKAFLDKEIEGGRTPTLPHPHTPTHRR